MRFVLPLLVALAVATSLAAASHGKLPHVDQGGATAGPCAIAWSIYWPGDHVRVGCAAAGMEIVYASVGSAALGHTCTVRAVDGAASFACPNTYQVLDDLLP